MGEDSEEDDCGVTCRVRLFLSCELVVLRRGRRSSAVEEAANGGAIYKNEAIFPRNV